MKLPGQVMACELGSRGEPRNWLLDAMSGIAVILILAHSWKMRYFDCG